MNQRTKFLVWVLFGGLLLAGHSATYEGSARPGPGSAERLKCEYLTEPVGIDARQPRLGWVLVHSERGEEQSAYEILVATRLDLLDQDKADQWASGRVTSEESTQVVYAGKPLVSGRTYWWKVRWWDSKDRISPWSAPARFEMGLLSRDDWKGQWIGGGNVLRKEFEVRGRVARARAYVTALGYYELRVNGEKVGDHVLDPAWTTYPKRVLYSTYDVTRYLQQSGNAVGVMLGGGWATLHHQKFRLPAYYDSPALLLQLNIEFQDGKSIAVVSDGSWKASQGPVLSNNIFDGEVYDARREVPGWDQPGLNENDWNAAQVVEGTKGEISAQIMPPIRAVDTLVPVAMNNSRRGLYVYDLGQNFSGWVRLRVTGPRGTVVKLRFSELVYPDGTINRENILEARAMDIYILKGEGDEVWEPRFTYHGFRYVELNGYPGTPNLDTIRGRVVHTSVRTVGGFAASTPILNQIHRIIRWTQLSNLHSVPTDCPQRNERMGWLGDAQVTAEEAMLNFDMASFYTNFIRNIRDSQNPDGSVSDTIPHKGPQPADPAWGSAYHQLCWYMYEQYGDQRILEENYEGLRTYVEFLRSRATDDILRFSKFGDWVSLQETPGEYVSTVYYYYDVLLQSKIAKALGKREEAKTYGELSTKIKDAINRTYFNAALGYYANGTQTANAMALLLGLVPSDRRGDVARRLRNDIIYYNNTHLTTGIHGTRFLFPALTSIDRSDLAYDLATQTSYPSWGHMISNGATTIWELWQYRVGPGMNSHNHPALGSVGAWFYQALAGIRTAAPGYRSIDIRPQLVRDLGWTSASLETVRGTVSCSWSRSPNGINMDVTVPVNSSARVLIPRKGQPRDVEVTDFIISEGDRTVWEKGKYVPGAPGIWGAEQSMENEGEISFQLGSGHYSFRLTAE